MKKLILICLLGYLCLSISTLTAQVADSPGADFLHRSAPHVSFGLGDTHRGEETRSDTLPEVFDLVDHSVAEGQEGESPSASVGEAAPVVVYVETRRVEAIDSMEFVVWDAYLEEKDLPFPEKYKLALTPGNMYEGSRQTARGQWSSAPLPGYSRLSMSNSRFTYFDRFLVSPGDSLRVRLDFENARMLFSGPDADKYRIQYELAIAFENYRYDQDPTMRTAKEEYWGYSEKDSLMIRSVIDANSGIRRKMEFITPGPEGLAYLKRYFAMDWKEHPGFGIIERYRDILDDGFLEILQTDLQGRLLYDRVHKFSIYYHPDESYRQFFEENIASNTDEIPPGAAYSSHYPEYLYEKLAIVSALNKEPFRNLLAGLPQSIHDQVFAKYIIKNYRRFEDSNRQFDLALSAIATPWIKEEISRLASAQRIGDPLVSDSLLNTQGNEYSLAEEEGKILLINFWLPGCHASSGNYQTLIKPVEEHFENDPEIKFVYVSHDADRKRWLYNVEAGEYSNPKSLNLNAEGQPDAFLDYYNIHYFPTYMVVDQEGKVRNIGNLPSTTAGLISYLESLKEKSEPSQSNSSL